MWGGGAAKMATQAISPPPRCGILPKIGGIWQSRQFPTRQGVPKVAKMSPKCCQNVAKMSPREVTWQVRVQGEKLPISRQFFNNGYNKKPFFQNRGGELLSTLLQCQSLPTSFPTSWESEYSAYIVMRHYKSWGEGGIRPQSASLHSTDNISAEDSEQARTKPDTIAHVEQ